MNEHSENGAKSTDVKSKANINSDDETLATAMKFKNADRDIPKASRKHQKPMTYSSGKSDAKGGSSTKVRSRVQQSKFPAAKASQDDNFFAATSAKKRLRHDHG